MNIGDTVTYIRHNKDGISEGIARLKGIGLNGEGRVVVLLKEGDNSFNTYVNCVNPSPEFCLKFRELVTNTNKLGEQGKAEQQAIVEKYNGLIKHLDDALLGKPVEI